MKKLLASLMLILTATSAVAAAPKSSTNIEDCEIMTANARMWRLAEQKKEPPVRLVSLVFIEYSGMVVENKLSERRALKLIGMLLIAKEIADAMPKASLAELEKKTRTECVQLFGKTM